MMWRRMESTRDSTSTNELEQNFSVPFFFFFFGNYRIHFLNLVSIERTISSAPRLRLFGWHFVCVCSFIFCWNLNADLRLFSNFVVEKLQLNHVNFGFLHSHCDTETKIAHKNVVSIKWTIHWYVHDVSTATGICRV